MMWVAWFIDGEQANTERTVERGRCVNIAYEQRDF